jgi:hypothetical protein
MDSEPAASTARLDRLADQQEVRDVIYRYCRGIDRRDYDLVRACYHADATDDHGDYRGGVDGFITYVMAGLPRYEATSRLATLPGPRATSLPTTGLRRAARNRQETSWSVCGTSTTSNVATTSGSLLHGSVHSNGRVWIRSNPAGGFLGRQRRLVATMSQMWCLRPRSPRGRPERAYKSSVFAMISSPNRRTSSRISLMPDARIATPIR